MGAAAIAFPIENTDEKHKEMIAYLSSEGGYWLNNDVWKMQDAAFKKAGLKVPVLKVEKKKGHVIADFSGAASDWIKVEAKYFVLHSLKEKYITLVSMSHNYTWAIRHLWKYMPTDAGSCKDVGEDWFDTKLPDTEKI